MNEMWYAGFSIENLMQPSHNKYPLKPEVEKMWRLYYVYQVFHI